MFSCVAREFPRIDVLVNNAAVFSRCPIESLESDQWDAIMAINARSPALCIKYALPMMNGGEGAIVNITDIAAENPLSAYAAYSASKAALLSLTKVAAKSLAKKNIRVNAVAPGIILWDENTTDAEKRAIMDKIPLNRSGRPEDIAAGVVFLAQHDYITGQTLRIDGGRCIG
jgi:pteridine reductase